jgi:mxaL protein
MSGNRWPLVAATVLLVVAAFVPQIRLPRTTFDYMVTFDISQSMNVTDVSLGGRAVSRLEFARAAMREALHRLPCGSKVGWSYFADYRSFTLLLPIEVCDNYDVLLSALDRIDGRMRWANASNIAKGVYWARRYAGTVAGVDIVFFTDGQEAPPVPAGRLPMPELRLPQVGGWLIGVGGDSPSRIPKTDDNGIDSGYWTADMVAQDPSLPPGTSHEQLSELRESYLKTLATQSGLGYRRLDRESALTGALLDRRSAHRARVPTDVRWVPALLAMLLLTWRYRPRP